MAVQEGSRELAVLLDYLKRSRGFDFTGYKPSSLMRRIEKRMQQLQLETYADYVDYLEVHPQEFTHLFNTILINVTDFFRDTPTWEYLAEEIVPRVLATKGPDAPVRVWCAGVASGEEAYSVAMILAEALGEDRFRSLVKIYATDVDEDALNHARQAIYGTKEVAGIPEDLLAKYFEQSNGRYVFRKDLRRSVIFGRHDLVQDAPISRIDLLFCRNTLMYFNSETQAKILSHFHFALNNEGYLILGKAEMLFTHANLFVPADLKRRIFTRVHRPDARDRVLVLETSDADDGDNHLAKHVRFREAAFDTSPIAQMAIDLNGFLILANERARALFGLTLRDIGRSFQELDPAYRIPGLRACIEQVYSQHRPATLKDIEFTLVSGDAHYLDVQVVPLMSSDGAMLGLNISFLDVTAHRHLQEEFQHTNEELETAYEELQSTNEELETTNEELQSTVEELETTNEELQSTNEELETMNEELQSTNEELQAMNDELNRRTAEMNQSNAFLESVLSGLRFGVAVLDRDLHIEAWNDRSEDLWGLRAAEVRGTHFLNLDIGLPVERLRQPVRSVLAGDSAYEEIMLEATNRRGKSVQVKVGCSPLRNAHSEVSGAILLMDDGVQAA